MRKIVITGMAAALGVSTAVAGGAFAGNPDSNGAQRSGLMPVSNSQPGSDQCVAGTGAGPNGFAIFNAPGRPGATIKFNGEVSLKNGAPDAVYSVYLVPDGGNCDAPAGMISTNGQGNGNAHLVRPGNGAGTYYVVLKDAAGNEQFATGTVAVQ